ncbi:MAG TPA: mechanosensitive ion channel domain-containing protein [Blastocatellia bacterium]|nr:mechanosensitive ion channel domain-containing protein [Blastocatellia bacterium]
MSIQLFLAPMLIFQFVIEIPVEILTVLRGRNIFYAALVITVTWLLVRLSTAFLKRLSPQTQRARFFFRLFDPTLRLFLWLGGTVIVLSLISPSRDTGLVVLVAMGIALGLGVHDVVKNIIGGLVILTDRPYRLGDRVKIGEVYGEVDQIGLRSTKLTTPDDSRVTVPNGKILSGAAWNANPGALDSQVVTDLYLPHDTDPGEALEIGYEAAYSSPYLLLAKPVIVLLQDKFHYAPHLVVRVKAHVYDHRFEPRLQSDITLRAKAEFLRRGLIGRGSRQLIAPAAPPIFKEPEMEPQPR